MAREKKWRYVEMTYERPGLDMEVWRAAVLEAESPDAAFEQAKSDLLNVHRDAFNVTEFMQRTITYEKAVRIIEQFHNNTWDGWPFHKEYANA